MDRRRFLAASASASMASLLGPRAFALGQDPAAPQNAAGDAELRIALVGCGGRGTGAAWQALSTDGATRLVAMADAFPDRLEGSLKGLQAQFGERVDVPAERRFTGFDAYRKAIDAGVDVVVMATPPGFRPMHFEYAVRQGKHVFMEKPVAVDGPGVRMVLAAAREAEGKGLKVGVGLQRHHQRPYQETVARIHDGMIGDPVLLRCYWNSAGVWVNPRKEGQTEMEYQMRNWDYFNWLCGDHIVEQHIHNLDVCNWVMQDYPQEAQGQGGREVRTGIDHGEIYDHHMVEYTYASGAKMLSQCRHHPGADSNVSEHMHGTEGYANPGAGRIERRDGEKWRYRDESPDPYQVEHDDLFAAIRAGTAYNEAANGAMSSATAILGRMATYSGKRVKMEDLLASGKALLPTAYAWDAEPPTLPDGDGRYPIAVPGVTTPW
jgi:predicted dehydrogenase